MTLIEHVKNYVGGMGPQHDTYAEYEAYVDQKINEMTALELLEVVSSVLEWNDVKI